LLPLEDAAILLGLAVELERSTSKRNARAIALNLRSMANNLAMQSSTDDMSRCVRELRAIVAQLEEDAAISTQHSASISLRSIVASLGIGHVQAAKIDPGPR